MGKWESDWRFPTQHRVLPFDPVFAVRHRPFLTQLQQLRLGICETVQCPRMPAIGVTDSRVKFGASQGGVELEAESRGTQSCQNSAE